MLRILTMLAIAVAMFVSPGIGAAPSVKRPHNSSRTIQLHANDNVWYRGVDCLASDNSLICVQPNPSGYNMAIDVNGVSVFKHNQLVIRLRQP